MELVSDNDEVFHFGSSKNYPTQYISLGIELFNLIGKDLFKLSEIANTKINSKYEELFKKDVFKSSFIIGMNLAKFDLIEENAVDIAKTIYNDGWSIKNISNVTALSCDEIISRLGLNTSI